jgi:phosphatidylglycerophosphate synthase
MLDRRARELCRPVLDDVSGWLSHAGVRANSLTGVGWLVGVGACVAVGARLWVLALVAWLLNRAIDGIDGALARRRGASDVGGYLDVLADFSIYAGFIVALAIAEPSTRLAGVVVLASYYLSVTAWLAATAMTARRGVVRRDDRSVAFVGGLAEGLETILAYSLILVAPSIAVWVEWTFSAMVLFTVFQRATWALRALNEPQTNVIQTTTRSVT